MVRAAGFPVPLTGNPSIAETGRDPRDHGAQPVSEQLGAILTLVPSDTSRLKIPPGTGTPPSPWEQPRVLCPGPGLPCAPRDPEECPRMSAALKRPEIPPNRSSAREGAQPRPPSSETGAAAGRRQHRVTPWLNLQCTHASALPQG